MSATGEITLTMTQNVLAFIHLLKGLEIRNLTITCENGRYYAVFCVKVPLPARKPGKKMIALDPNHKNFAYGVDTTGIGIEVLIPKWLKTYDKRIDELKSRKDRCNRFQKKTITEPMMTQ